MVMVVVVVVVVGFNLSFSCGQLVAIIGSETEIRGRKSLFKTLVAFPVAAAAAEYGVSRQYIEGVLCALPQFSAPLLSRLLISFASSFHHQAKLILYFVSRKRKNAESKH